MTYGIGENLSRSLNRSWRWVQLGTLIETLGKTIVGVDLRNDQLRIYLDGDLVLILEDGGQSCCEKRYMVIDDDLDEYVGAKLLGFETKDAPDVESGEVHEVQFLEVMTSVGPITAANHNEHNGYYGGFDVTARLESTK